MWEMLLITTSESYGTPHGGVTFTTKHGAPTGVPEQNFDYETIGDALADGWEPWARASESNGGPGWGTTTAMFWMKRQMPKP